MIIYIMCLWIKEKYWTILNRTRLMILWGKTIKETLKILLRATLFWYFDANAVTWWERSSRSIEVSPLVIWSSNTSYMNLYWDTFETRHRLCPRSHRTVPKTRRQEYINIFQAISLAPEMIALHEHFVIFCLVYLTIDELFSFY